MAYLETKFGLLCINMHRSLNCCIGDIVPLSGNHRSVFIVKWLMVTHFNSEYRYSESNYTLKSTLIFKDPIYVNVPGLFV